MGVEGDNTRQRSNPILSTVTMVTILLCDQLSMSETNVIFIAVFLFTDVRIHTRVVGVEIKKC